jgi:hypothetical protein
VSKTTVVNVKYDTFDVYIGRRNAHYRFYSSRWANPYIIGPGCTREHALELYEKHLRNNPSDLFEPLDELRGKRLGCWCAPLPCHGDLLARLADMSWDERIEWLRGDSEGQEPLPRQLTLDL